MSPEQKKLRERYEAKVRAGLVDVKFTLNRRDKPDIETLCAEVNRMDGAIDAGRAEPFSFNDRHDHG